MIGRLPARAITSWLLTGGLILTLGGAAMGVLSAMERQRPPEVRAVELLYLPKGEYLKVAVLGYRQIVADLIWLKAVQHFGERKQTNEGYLWTYHAVDVLTDLDPEFAYAYQAAGTILGVWAGLVQESMALLTKGMRHNPEAWQLPFYLGYDYFYELCDPASAAQYFRRASALPGAPPYLPRLAARMTVEAGDPDAALEFLERLSQQVQDQRLREALALRMKEVIAERDIRFLEEGVRLYRDRYRKLPDRLENLVTGGIILQIPEEPLGGRYELQASNGTVGSTAMRERLRVHRHVPCQVLGKQ
jgi:tetratricopeptide (TPR) repeat protein